MLAYGTTQADYWYGDVPCTRKLTPAEIKTDYEANTGEVIVETFKKLKFDPLQHPAVLVASHGPFTWGKDAHDAVHNASVLEFIARLNSETLRINPKIKPMQPVCWTNIFCGSTGRGRITDKNEISLAKQRGGCRLVKIGSPPQYV